MLDHCRGPSRSLQGIIQSHVVEHYDRVAPNVFQFFVLGRSKGESISSTVCDLVRDRSQTYGQLYFAYAPMRNTMTSGLCTSSSCAAGLAGGKALEFLQCMNNLA